MSELVFLTEADVEQMKLEAIRAFVERVEKRTQNDHKSLKKVDGLSVQLAWLEAIENELRAMEAENESN